MCEELLKDQEGVISFFFHASKVSVKLQDFSRYEVKF